MADGFGSRYRHYGYPYLLGCRRGGVYQLHPASWRDQHLSRFRYGQPFQPESALRAVLHRRGKRKSNTDEGDIIATVSTAVSSIVTILVIIIGVILIAATPLADLLAKPAAQKAADYLLPALFGALAVVYVSRNPKIAFPPVILMVALCIAIPKIESIISILVPFVAIFTVGVARIMYKKGWLGKNEPEKTAVDVETNNVALDTEDTDKFIDELDNK